MQTPRTVLKIDAATPGTEIAAETAAAMASASMVFRAVDDPYATLLSTKAEDVLALTSTCPSLYSIISQKSNENSPFFGFLLAAI